MKKITNALLSAGVALALVAGNVSAADWATCTPSKLGVYVEDEVNIVRLQVTDCTSDPTNGMGWVTISASSSNQIMATILTAISLGKTVGVAYDNDITDIGYNVAQGIMLKNQ